MSVAKEPDCELWQRKRGRKRGKIRKGEANVLIAKEPDCELWQRKRGKKDREDKKWGGECVNSKEAGL